ncbi:hypothetical protein BC828DRAFT_367259 [Blastocladiella britannica]|nr:hypothetical protein BC828DRAFT_367259 [Blastocladiella britannica]
MQSDATVPYTGSSLETLRTSMAAFTAPRDPLDTSPPAPPPRELARFMSFAGLGAFWGMLLGGAIGARTAGHQFLAEHAHHLPVTVPGWYFYHKQKNYRVVWGAVTRGLREAGRLGTVVAVFSAVETAVDVVAERESPASSVVAGQAAATAFAIANRLPRASFRKALLYGTVAGAVVGGVQEIGSYFLGIPIKYAPRDQLEAAAKVLAGEGSSSSAPSPSGSLGRIQL